MNVPIKNCRSCNHIIRTKKQVMGIMRTPNYLYDKQTEEYLYCGKNKEVKHGINKCKLYIKEVK